MIKECLKEGVEGVYLGSSLVYFITCSVGRGYFWPKFILVLTRLLDVFFFGSYSLLIFINFNQYMLKEQKNRSGLCSKKRFYKTNLLTVKWKREGNMKMFVIIRVQEYGNWQTTASL